MAEGGPPAAPNAHDVPEKSTTAVREPIRLGTFGSSLSVPETFSTTARYAQDPPSYLRDALGSDTFEQRKHLLFLSNEVDKDIYGNGSYRSRFAQHIANLLGKNSGLFFITGIQAQLAAIKVHCNKAGNNRVAWHRTSHLEFAEESAFDKLYGLDRIFLGQDEEHNPTIDEIKKVLSLPKGERPAVVLLEIPNRTLGCKTCSFAELEQISSACKAADVIFHCDGARIWEIEPFYQHSAGKSFADIAALFDSIYVSFYKGLHGVAGAILAGEEDLIQEAKVWQKRAGGNVVTLMYEVVDDARGFNENIGTFQKKWNKMYEVQDQILDATAKFQTSSQERIVDFTAQPATCCQVKTTYSGFSTNELNAARDEVEKKMHVRVFERVGRQKNIAQMAEMLSVRNSDPSSNPELDDQVWPQACEWMIGPDTVNLPTKLFVDAYVALCEELLAAKKEST